MEQLLTELEQAAEGLYMVSETDATFEPVDFGQQPQEEFNQQRLLKLLGKPEGTPIEMQELQYFLRNMTTAREGASESKLEEVKRFQGLQKLFVEQLTGVKVYRVGKIQVDAYILGWTNDSHLIGLKTSQVET